jgi:3',5'-cyclic AMP phosphodiesterase CpdA
MFNARRGLRRCFLFVALFTCAVPILGADEDPTPLRIGIFADLHAHDTDSPLDRFLMVDWAERLQACVDAMNAWPADLMIELGDFINGRFVLGAELGDPERIPAILSAVDAVYAAFDGPRYYVLGNHDVGDLTKAEFLEHVGAEATTSSFDVGGVHVVLLDAQYREDGSDRGREFWYMTGFIPEHVLDWLRDDLASSELPTIVCLHQRLDLEFEIRHGGPEVLNHEEVRELLVGDGDVIAVFQGHDHGGGYSYVDGIHYVTFTALIGRIGGKPPTWAYVTLDPTVRTIEIVGEGEQQDLLLNY